MILNKNKNNNQGVFLELLVAAKKYFSEKRLWFIIYMNKTRW